ncbi:MAG: FAD-dependent monooxygenase [Methylotenera sp.]|nr:FAD-dependent monooxygenase [Methylotenera sp.]
MTVPIVIVGGGPVGATLALLLAQQGLPVSLLEARKLTDAYQESRALALSFGSRRVLEKVGVWDALANSATAINSIHVSQKGSLGRSWLQAADLQQEALGYVLSYGDLSRALYQALQQQTSVNCLFGASAEYIEHNAEQATVRYTQLAKEVTLNSPLVVLADGGRSLNAVAGLTRETKEYGHDALISMVDAELAHGNMAFERFTEHGPLALLPNGKTAFSLVWTGKTDYVAQLMALSDADFLKAFHQQFGDRLGQFLTVGKRMRFPLKLSQLKTKDVVHLVVIGNAAQTMHPVAGQGFNVGLRDAVALAASIAACSPANYGDSTMLQTYQSSRQADTKGGLLFTDFLVNIFSNDILGLPALRSSGLALFDVIKPIKRHLLRKMSFGK